MGTRLTKMFSQEVQREKMTGLDTEQLNILRSMWVVIDMELDMHSRIIFRRFFQEHPEYLRFFRALTHTPSSRVHIDSVCRVHFKAILSCLGTILQCVVDRTPSELRSHIEYVALIHSRTDLTLRDFLLFRDLLTNYLCSEVPQSRYKLTDLVWTSFLTSLFQNIFSRIGEIHRLEQQNVEFITEDEPWLHCKPPLNFSRKVADNWYWSHRKKFWQVQTNHWAYAPNIEPISEDSPDSKRKESATDPDKKWWDTSRMKRGAPSSVDKRTALESSDQAQSRQGEEEAPSPVASVKSKARVRRRNKVYQTLRSGNPVRD